MKAVMLTGGGAVEIVDKPVPRAKGDWVVVKMEAAGICGTDTELLLHAKEPSGIVPGHEVAGVVHEVDEDCGFSVGERVLVNCHVTCGTCEHCHNGDLIFCPDLRAVGFELDGGDAEYLLVPAASLRHLPDDISTELAVIAGDALGTPWEAVRKAHPEKGKTIAVFGVGPLGQMAVLCLKHEGAHVIAVDLNDERLKSAVEFGADETVNSGAEDAAGKLRELTGGRGVDAAIQCSPSGKAINQALDSLKYRGLLVQVGVCSSVTINPHKQINDREITIAGSRNFNDNDLDKLFDLMRSNPKIKDLITHRFPLSRAKEAFETAEQGRGIKILLVPDAE